MVCSNLASSGEPPASQNHLTTVFSIKFVHNFELGSQCLMYAAQHRILCLHFNSHFPDEPELASVYWCKGWWRWWWQLNYWSYKSCKAPVKSAPPTNQHPVSFTGWMPILSPNQQCQITEGKNITFHVLVYPKLTRGLPTLSLTTNNSWLPWGGLPCLSSALWFQYPGYNESNRYKYFDIEMSKLTKNVIYLALIHY